MVGTCVSVIGVSYGTLWEDFVSGLDIWLVHTWGYIKVRFWHMVWCKGLWYLDHGLCDVLIEEFCWLYWYMSLVYGWDTCWDI